MLFYGFHHHNNCVRSRTYESGIAVGPILFIIAMLAILAAAIAAGGGSFNASTSNESAKAMAGHIIQTGHAYRDALDLVFGNGCDVTTLDWTPNGGGYPTGATWTSGDYSLGGTGHTGNGSCALFDPRGGGMIYKQLPATALNTTLTGLYSGNEGTILDPFAGYPLFFGTVCLNGLGTCPLIGSATANASLIMVIPYISYAVCQQINSLLKLPWDPNSTYLASLAYQYNTLFYPQPLKNIGAANIVQIGFNGYSGISEGCAQDQESNFISPGRYKAYVYVIALMVR